MDDGRVRAAPHRDPAGVAGALRGLFHGLQLWVNLPAADKFAAPRYQGIERDQLTLLASADGASLVRVIAGEVDGHGGPGSTHTPSPTCTPR